MNSDESSIETGPKRRVSNRHNRLSVGRNSGRQSSSVIPVLSAEYLNRYSSKADLVNRLREIVNVLSDTNSDVEANSPDYPGLAGLSRDLIQDRYLKHKDKEVRLQTVLACMEIFSLYAPEAPWDEEEILLIFPQIIQQLSNLSTCISPSQPNYSQYFRLLEQLAQVQIGAVLVEMIRTLDPEADFSLDDMIMNDRNNPRSSHNMSMSMSMRRNSPTSDETLEVLRELIEVLLTTVQHDHPSQVTEYAIQAITTCIVEFDATVPIPVLDEILKCIGAGPVLYVTNPAYIEATATSTTKTSKQRGKNVDSKKLPPMHIQQTNQSYLVACGVIRKTVDRISTPIASLLNGLLNGDANIIKSSNIAIDEPEANSTTTNHNGKKTSFSSSSSIIGSTGCIPERNQPNADVWNIVYELHKISPQILTTVIGTVASSLQSPDDEKRLRVTKLLGRLFYSKSSNIATNFHPCFTEWIKRSLDLNVKIRETMVKCLMEILKKKNVKVLGQEASQALVKMVNQDPSLDVRLLCIHEICNLAYLVDESSSSSSVTTASTNSATPMISASLLKAVGNRVSSKNKRERLDSITGLAKIYHRQYILSKLKHVQERGDDCDIDMIIDTIENNCDLNLYSSSGGGNSKVLRDKNPSKRKSPSKFGRFEVAGATADKYDIDEKYTFIPRLIFESAFFTDVTDPVMRNRVIMIIDDVILGTENNAVREGNGTSSNNKNTVSPTSRALGITMIINYLLTSRNDHGEVKGENSPAYRWMYALLAQRAKLQNAIDSYLHAKSEAEKLPSGSEERSNAKAAAYEKLQHVASLSSPPSANASPGTSTEDLDLILNKIHTARDRHIFRLLKSISFPSHSSAARSRALDDLPKRTKSLGPSAASWIKSLARRCSMGYFLNAEIIAHCIILAQEAFNERNFPVCMAFLESVKVASNIYPSLGSTKESFETLVELFGHCRGSLTIEEKKKMKQTGILTTLSAILALVAPSRTSPSSLDMNSKTPESADSVGDFDSGLQSELFQLCTKDGTPEQARHAVQTMAALSNKNEEPGKLMEVFGPLLKTLTSPARLRISRNETKNTKIVNVLTTLTAMVESVPIIFGTSDRKRDRAVKAIHFALETVLLGRGQETDDTQSDHEAMSDSEDDQLADLSMNKSKQRKSPGKKSPRRSNSFSNHTVSITCQQAMAAIEFLACHIRSTILYSRNTTGKDFFEKNDGTDTNIIPTAEHISAVFDVLVKLIRDEGLLPYSQGRRDCKGVVDRNALKKCASVNLLRLCDGSLNLESKYLSPRMWHILSRVFLDQDELVRDTTMNELSMMLIGGGKYSGFVPSLRFLACIALCPDNELNVGKRSSATKEAAHKCIVSLRRTCDETMLKCRAMSRKAEENFDKNLKMKLMPEFSVPYAFHLLAFRPDTPSGGVDHSNDYDEESQREEEARHKMLHKRLRWLLEPLVQSLGEGADNISFLLRLSELLGQRYRPVDVSESNLSQSPISPFSDISFGNEVNNELAHAKLKVICAGAREVLLKFVKKDIHLTPYPGVIQIPSVLYARVKQTSPTAAASKSNNNIDFKNNLENGIGNELLTPTSGPKKQRKTGSAAHNSKNVNFVDVSGADHVKHSARDGIIADFGENLSPIPQSRSPGESHFDSNSKDNSQTPSSTKSSGRKRLRRSKPRASVETPESDVSSELKASGNYSSSSVISKGSESKESSTSQSSSNTSNKKSCVPSQVSNKRKKLSQQGAEDVVKESTETNVNDACSDDVSEQNDENVTHGKINKEKDGKVKGGRYKNKAPATKGKTYKKNSKMSPMSSLTNSSSPNLRRSTRLSRD